ncbi:hypothetical protein OBJ97_06840 [Empedobacter falsenii]|uniref:hypothetical protein n=1 Tax=Empedobacter falsenii TaxID=343874 RepID=UPI00126A30A9|nr:hypothetical protein [Empedobacter falsenii]
MKHLEKNDSTTIEHLYPQKPQPYNSFTNYSITCIEKTTFNYLNRNLPNSNLDNLPHDISYYNLLACCKNCNHTRGTKELKPFVFDNAVKTKFHYNINGNIYSNEYADEISNIGLASERYVNFRRLWKYIASKHPNIVSFDYRSLEKIIKTSALEMYNTTKSLFYIEFTMNGLLVKEAFQYRYFYNN